MTNTLLLYGLIALIIAVVAFLYPVTTGLVGVLGARKSPEKGVVKHDWWPTGRIDFTTRLFSVAANARDRDQPSEFKLLVEERRIVESITGNENLEIRWRLAKLSEAKAVVTQYHKYLAENSLIKTAFDDLESPSVAKPQSDDTPEEPVKQLASHATAGSTAIAPAQGEILAVPQAAARD
jgi:hypothetical protein